MNNKAYENRMKEFTESNNDDERGALVLEVMMEIRDALIDLKTK